MLLSAAAAADLTALNLTTLEIVKRLLCAMLVGGVIGAEREIAHRPAGMRTDMMVCIGSCAVMLIGQQIFCQYNAYGATPDPSRLSAQVISGVGFLGAGTIMNEGLTVRGLTTAASLWVVACLGIAVGGGYYMVALVGTVCIFVTLTFFKRLQNRYLEKYNASYIYMVLCSDITACLKTLNGLAEKSHTTVSGLHVKLSEEDETYHVKFQVDFKGEHCETRNQEFLEQLCAVAGVQDVRCDGTFNEMTR